MSDLSLERAAEALWGPPGRGAGRVCGGLAGGGRVAGRRLHGGARAGMRVRQGSGRRCWHGPSRRRWGWAARVQFTPDLMPTDVTGGNVFDQQAGKACALARSGLLLVLMGDEINRTPPKTQSALLGGDAGVAGHDRRLRALSPRSELLRHR